MNQGGRTSEAAPYPMMRLGPVTLPAPPVAPRQIEAAHGHLWQWVGDGEPLLSLTVAVRETQMGDSTGVLYRLNTEIDLVRGLLDDPDGASVERNDLVFVQGSTAAPAGAAVDGMRDGMPVRIGIVVASDGVSMHVIQVSVAEGKEGRALAAHILDQIEITPWRDPG